MAVSCIVSYPTYLRCMLQDEGYINLFYCQNTTKTNSFLCENVENVVGNSNILDLTGTPLETDLQETDLNTEQEELLPVANNWTKDEENHYPMSLREARKLLNKKLMEETFSDGEVDSNLSFCICDGNDDQNIVLLGGGNGGNIFTRIQLSSKGLFKQNDIRMHVSSMIKAHQNNTDDLINPQVEHSTSWTYQLKPKKFTKQSCNGSVTMHITSKNIDIIDHQSVANLSFDVVANNTSSYLYMFWKDLILLDNLIQVAKIGNINENIEISKEPIDSDILLKQLADELNKVSFEDDCEVETDGNNLYNSSENRYLLYNLWDLFKNCKDIMHLNKCVTYFVDLVRNKQDIKKYFFENDSTEMDFVIKGILEGTITRLDVKDTVALQLLVNFGLEKLKNEYFQIITGFGRKSGFLKIWESACRNLRGQEDIREDFPRHSRFTVPTLITSAVSKMENSLLLLFKLHVIANFLLLKTEYCEFSEELSQSIAMEMMEKYLGYNSPINNLSDVTKNALYNFNTTVNYVPPNINGDLLMWLFKQTTKLKRTTVTTTFNKSKSSIIPPNIYSDYKIPTKTADGSTDCYYLTELVMYTDAI